LNSILQKIVDHKLTEISSAKANVAIESVMEAAQNAAPALDFVGALQQRKAAGSIGLIAEVKKASPSKGIIRALTRSGLQKFMPDMVRRVSAC